MLQGLTSKLLAPEAIASAVAQIQRETAARQNQTLKDRGPMEKELAVIARKLERAQAMCMEGVMEIKELKKLSTPLKSRRDELQDLLAEIGEPSVVSLHPGMAEAYRQMALQLQSALEQDDGNEARDAVRALFEKVVFIPLPGLGQFDLEIQGNLARLLRISTAAESQTHKSPAASSSGAFETCHRSEVLVGAGVGFEPTTFRL